VGTKRKHDAIGWPGFFGSEWVSHRHTPVDEGHLKPRTFHKMRRAFFKRHAPEPHLPNDGPVPMNTAPKQPFPGQTRKSDDELVKEARPRRPS